MSYEQIGKILGLDRTTVRDIERRALAKLARIIRARIQAGQLEPWENTR